MQNRPRHHLAALSSLAVTVVLSVGVRAGAGMIFNDLAATNGGAETASGTNWLTAAFTTDSTAYTTLSTTLLLQNTSAGAAELDIYSDGGLRPGTLKSVLTSPATYSSSSLANATFTGSGLTLSANTKYWLVLKATSGAFDWGWTNDDSIVQEWGTSSNSGSVWFTDNAFPFQYSVTGTVPEPRQAAAVAIALMSIAFTRRTRHA